MSDRPAMFDTVLIANRGEIACRIIRTCRRLGVRTVAVYSEADREALHVALADEAHLLGPAPARESYLDIGRVIAAARAAGAQAIHPGYGFLSENADFAQACADAGLVFIGPPAQAIRAMGSKSEAKALMERAGVPLVPGYHGADQNTERLHEAADAIGYPVLLKPSGGGGGKGMRVVRATEEFREALAGACREAAAAFGDERMLIEKYLTAPRHVEIQVFLDTHGHAVHLFERDCSVQRRHQKIIEEAPAPGLAEATREAMGRAALDAARAIGYVGAGTVEFIMGAAGAFHFMEMNTRLQVEHPVTEMITGQDLVEWQLRVAAGQPLPLAQGELAIHGHAFETRLYAEDPARGFLPASGRITHLRLPEESPWLRLDSGVRQGDVVSVHYDPLMAKLIVWGEDRDQALGRLRRALGACQIAGPASNVSFLARVAAQSDFAAAHIDTGFIETHESELLPLPEPVSDRVLAVASLWQLLRVDAAGRAAAAASGDPHSPWHATDGWRMNSDNVHALHYRDGGRELVVRAHYRGDGFLLDCPGARLAARGELAADEAALTIELEGTRLNASVTADGDAMTVFVDGESVPLTAFDPLSAQLEESAAPGRLTAPMAGTVVSVAVAQGEAVSRGQTLMVLEAMKMEHTITAVSDGEVERVNYAAGEQVEDGAELIVIST